MIYFWNVNALFEITPLIYRCYLDLVIKNILENRIRGFVDSLNRQRKDSVKVENLEIQKTYVEIPCKALLFYLTLNIKVIWMVRHSFLLCFLSSCLNSLFRLQCICLLMVN
jgi:hypothetical protein